ncbi:MAG TPA: MBL fold metallo-hydrolase [Steroidobacteraceae bacterium]|nr:MBL fold metallo-hydrolase [Steroidobacteraceae bacterium]
MKYICFAALASCSLASAAGLVAKGPPQWHPGAEECTPDTTHTEIREIDDVTYVLRQNPCVDYEANLVYLLLGTQRALLIDTGAVEGEKAAPLAGLVWLALERAGKGKLPLLVAHTHGHLDHRAGDQAFARLPNTVIAPGESAAMREVLGFKDWPNDIARIDLGGRIVDLIPTPGHHEDHIVFYDRQSERLFTGDFLLQGRLLVDDLDAYHASAQRVVDFIDKHPVSEVLGAHIELDVTGTAYPTGATFHPNERVRPLTTFDVRNLPAALADFNGFYSRHPNFIVVNPIHNLLALASGIVVALAFLVWMGRRLWRRRRVSAG